MPDTKATEYNFSGDRIKKTAIPAGVSGGVAVVVFLIVMGLRGFFPRGKYVYSGDSMDQVAPFSRMMWENLLSGKGIFYSWALSFGGNSSLVNAFYAYDPLNLFFVFVKDAHTALICIMCCKVFLSVFFMYLFLKRVCKCSDTVCFLFSLSYGLCSYQIYFFQSKD